MGQFLRSGTDDPVRESHAAREYGKYCDYLHLSREMLQYAGVCVCERVREPVCQRRGANANRRAFLHPFSQAFNSRGTVNFGCLCTRARPAPGDTVARVRADLNFCLLLAVLTVRFRTNERGSFGNPAKPSA